MCILCMYHSFPELFRNFSAIFFQLPPARSIIKHSIHLIDSNKFAAKRSLTDLWEVGFENLGFWVF